MTDRPDPRKQPLADALRANLRRRKAQAQARDRDAPEGVRYSGRLATDDKEQPEG